MAFSLLCIHIMEFPAQAFFGGFQNLQHPLIVACSFGKVGSTAELICVFQLRDLRGAEASNSFIACKNCCSLSDDAHDYIMEGQNNLYMSSKPHKIFGPYSSRVGGLEPVTGRNAQFPTMARKQEYSEVAASERPYISPFSGYTSNSETNFSISQAVEFNPELTRKLVREQLLRQMKQEPVRNDVGILKTQIRSIKEFLEGFRDKMDKENEEDRESLQQEVKAQMAQLLEDHRVQTARNLREVLKKFDENIKKEILVQFGIKFLPVSFVDDMDKQFNELEDRIQIVEAKLQGNKSRPCEDPVVIAETYELRLKKIERETEYLKKAINETQHSATNLEAETVELKSKQQSSMEKITYLNDDFQKIKQEIERENKKIFHTIEENNKLINSMWDDKLKGISQELSKKISSTSSNQVKEFLNSSYNLTVSGVFENQNNLSIQSVSKDEEQPARLILQSPSKHPPQPQKSGLESSGGKQKSEGSPPSVNKSPQIDKLEEKEGKDQQKQMVYLIDKQNFLLDAEGSYITDGEGSQIKLSEEQVELIRKSNVVKMIEE